MIRKTLTAACVALAFAGGLASPAFAASTNIVTNNVFFLDMQYGDGFDTFADFGDSAAARGATIDDVFLFFAPPTWSTIDFFGEIDRTRTGAATFKFTGFDFGVLNYELTDANFNVTGINGTSLAIDQASLTRSAFNGESADPLNSGIYYLEVKGTTLVAGGGFSGSVSTTAIPEPTNVALLLAGIGLVGTMARRRKQAA